MKLTTLNYIHELLVHNEKATLEAKRLVYDARRKAKEEEADNYEYLCECCSKSKESWDKAYEVLKDFEEHEWR